MAQLFRKRVAGLGIHIYVFVDGFVTDFVGSRIREFASDIFISVMAAFRHLSVRDLCCQRECRRERKLRIEEREKDKRGRARR